MYTKRSYNLHSQFVSGYIQFQREIIWNKSCMQDQNSLFTKLNETADVYSAVPKTQLKNMDEELNQSNVFLDVLNKSGYTAK